MSAVKHIVWRFCTSWEATNATELAECAEPRKATGQQLMRIRLVSRVKDDPIHRGIHHSMKGDREFHHAEARPEMAASDGRCGDDCRSDLLGNLVELDARERLQAGGAIKASEQRVSANGA
jgi:hypothetical protein